MLRKFPNCYNKDTYSGVSKTIRLLKSPYENNSIWRGYGPAWSKASDELRQMLRYFEHTVLENAQSEPLKELHRMVDQVKRDKEVSTEFMLWSEWETLWKEAGREESARIRRRSAGGQMRH